MDRKDAIRSYKETPRPMGIWRVRNLSPWGDRGYHPAPNRTR